MGWDVFLTGHPGLLCIIIKAKPLFFLFPKKAVICGGFDGLDYLRTCFDYSLEKDEWSESGFGLKEEAADAAAVVLGNGSAIIGG